MVPSSLTPDAPDDASTLAAADVRAEGERRRRPIEAPGGDRAELTSCASRDRDARVDAREARSTLEACRGAGVQAFDGDDPIAFVLSENLHRRHLSESQRAMVAAKVANLAEGRPSETAAIGAVSQSTAASQLNVSRGSVQRARVVQTRGAPEVVEAVERGALAVSTAALERVRPHDGRNLVALEGASTPVIAASASSCTCASTTGAHRGAHREHELVIDPAPVRRRNVADHGDGKAAAALLEAGRPLVSLTGPGDPTRLDALHLDRRQYRSASSLRVQGAWSSPNESGGPQCRHPSINSR